MANAPIFSPLDSTFEIVQQPLAVLAGDPAVTWGDLWKLAAGDEIESAGLHSRLSMSAV